MQFERSCRNGVLLLRVAQRALVRAPDWDGVAGDDGEEARIVALDLQEAEFVSSLFWQACVELHGRLAAQSRELVLLNLDESQRRLLELIEGATRMPVLGSKAELDRHAARGLPRARSDEGVTGREKRMLWG
ncbi:MAG: hypothetical protein R6X33_15850 [Candidatus Brocadiia bacterium]